MRTPLMIVLLLFFGPGDGSREGRKGNALHALGQYDAASQAYGEGLAAIGDDTSPYQTRLLNNLGATLHRQENYENAKSSFNRALATATEDADYARAAYNLGNNAVRMESLDEALEYYKEALRNDPTNADAKFNYEFIKRQQEQNQDQNQDQENQDQENQDQQNQDQQNQDQQNQDQQNQDQQNQDQQNQDQQNQDQQQDQQEQQQDQQQQPDPNQMSQEQAERILEALENEEEQLLRQVQKMKTRPRRVEKDW